MLQMTTLLLGTFKGRRCLSLFDNFVIFVVVVVVIVVVVVVLLHILSSL